VSGKTTGSLTLGQAAFGGVGGSAYNGSVPGPAGAGGNATSTLDLTDASASGLNATAYAQGGDGGSVDNGAPGTGGAGTATPSVTSTAATSGVTGYATAYGGGGGDDPGTGLPAAGGAATASASVSANGGAGVAAASASGGHSTWGANALATAHVTNASSGSAEAAAESSGIDGYVATQSTASVAGGASATSAAGVSNGAPALLPIVAGSMDSQAYLTPTGLNQAVGAMESGYGGAGSSLDYITYAAFALPTSVAEGLALTLSSSSSSGWTSATLAFDVYSSDNGWTDYMFTSLTSAQTFFDNNTIDLGAYGAGSLPFVELYFDFTSSTVGDGFGFTYAVHDPPIAMLAPALAAATTATPEPSTWAMMALGFAGIGFARYRTSRTSPRSRGQGRVEGLSDTAPM
jgi:hypothetical protein